MPVSEEQCRAVGNFSSWLERQYNYVRQLYHWFFDHSDKAIAFFEQARIKIVDFVPFDLE